MTTDYKQLDRWMQLLDRRRGCIKVVVFDEDDYVYARGIRARYPGYDFYVQVGNRDVTTDEKHAVREQLLVGLEWLQERVLADNWHDVSVLPQLHTLVHGNKRGI